MNVDGKEDFPAHTHMWGAFTRFSLYTTIAVVLLLALMALFLV